MGLTESTEAGDAASAQKDSVSLWRSVGSSLDTATSSSSNTASSNAHGTPASTANMSTRHMRLRSSPSPLNRPGAAIVEALPPLALDFSDKGATSSEPPFLKTRANTVVRGLRKIPDDKQKLFYSLLVHTVSHRDMLFALSSNSKRQSQKEIVGKPSFSHFLPLSKLIFDKLRNLPEDEVEPVEAPMDQDADRFFPVGYRFKTPIPVESWTQLRVPSKSLDLRPDKPSITAVFFPLMSVIMPLWLDICNTKSKHGLRWIYLVSGSATPWNPDHVPGGNSTQMCSMLLAEFVRQFFPDAKVIMVHSGTEIFHYDENVRFVNSHLLPLIERVRDELSDQVYEEWCDRLHVTLSVSAGAAARVAAITASLRQFRPDSLHMWQHKTFWYQFPKIKMNSRDLQYHSFNMVEMTPPRPISELTDSERLCAEEMIAHKKAFESVRDSSRYHELTKFWLRKSRKPVLSVLMIQKKGHAKPLFVRGINSEVSLPTGSLCAERNAIGTALASDLTLVRKDMKMVAVLTLSMEKFSSGSHRTSPKDDPSAAGTGWLPSFLTASQSNEEEEKGMSRPALQRQESALEDRNPIAPCGACNEWLRKIAEVNPSFRVLTFSDEECSKVFVKPVA